MVTYIKSDVRNIYIELENELTPELYPNLGTTWEDYLDNLFVKLSDEQVAFKNEHPKAKVHEVWNMELDPVHVRNLDDAKNEKKSELARYKEQYVGDFKYNGTKVWLSDSERVVKKAEAENAKNNGIETYLLSPELDAMPVNDALAVINSMTSRELACNQAVASKIEEIDALEDIETVDGVDVSEGFPTEVEVSDATLEKQTETEAKNNVQMQVMKLMTKQINSMELSDTEALEVKLLYPEWTSFIGEQLEIGMRVLHKNKLYNVITPVNPVQDLDGHRPGEQGSQAMYTEINETNEGTFEDPIPYNNNMELFEGKYYIQDGIIYKCTRDSQTPLYHPLSSLVGIYVEVATE